MFRNVVVNALGGTQVKGFQHRIVGNTATDCVNADVNIMRQYPNGANYVPVWK